MLVLVFFVLFCSFNFFSWFSAKGAITVSCLRLVVGVVDSNVTTVADQLVQKKEIRFDGVRVHSRRCGQFAADVSVGANKTVVRRAAGGRRVRSCASVQRVVSPFVVANAKLVLVVRRVAPKQKERKSGVDSF